MRSRESSSLHSSKCWMTHISCCAADYYYCRTMETKSCIAAAVFFVGLIVANISAAVVGYGREVPIPAGTRARYYVQGHNGVGTYKFGYDTGSGPSQSFRQEERLPDGTVKGRYGYVDPRGTLRVVEYKADKGGFHIVRMSSAVPDQPRPKPVFHPPTPFVGPLPPFIRAQVLNSLY